MGARAIRKKGSVGNVSFVRGSLRFYRLTRRQPHLLSRAIQSHEELPQKVHPQQPINRGRMDTTREKY